MSKLSIILYTLYMYTLYIFVHKLTWWLMKSLHYEKDLQTLFAKSSWETLESSLKRVQDGTQD